MTETTEFHSLQDPKDPCQICKTARGGQGRCDYCTSNPAKDQGVAADLPTITWDQASARVKEAMADPDYDGSRYAIVTPVRGGCVMFYATAVSADGAFMRLAELHGEDNVWQFDTQEKVYTPPAPVDPTQPHPRWACLNCGNNVKIDGRDCLERRLGATRTGPVELCWPANLLWTPKEGA